MEKVALSPDVYIQSLPDDIRPDLMRLDELIAQEMKGLSRVLWQGKFWGGTDQSIIGYGDYTYVRPRKKTVEWFIIGLAVQKNYISIYVSAAEGKQYLSEKYADAWGKVKVGKSSISFKKAEDLNVDVLAEVVRRARDLMT